MRWRRQRESSLQALRFTPLEQLAHDRALALADRVSALAAELLVRAQELQQEIKEGRNANANGGPAHG